MAFANGRIPTSAMSPIPAAFHTHGTTAYLRADAADAFLRVAHAFQQRFGKRLVAMSFYRPQSDQIRIFLKNYYRYKGPRRPGTTDRSFNGATYRKRSGMSPVASPGYSNHGLGTTVDFNSGVQYSSTDEFRWMQSVGTQHGWDWAAGRRVNEPWHWEYIPSKDRRRGAPKATGSGTPASSTTVADLATTQATLKDLGYDPGPIDGKYGTRTETATRQAQHDLGITPADGKPGPATRKELSDMASKIDRAIDILEQNQREIRAIPGRVLDAEVDLEGAWKGQKSTLRRMRAWYAEDLRQIKEGVATSRAAVLKAVQETGKAQGLTDAQVQEIASAAAEAAARVSAEDVAERLEVTVTKEG